MLPVQEPLFVTSEFHFILIKKQTKKLMRLRSKVSQLFYYFDD